MRRAPTSTLTTLTTLTARIAPIALTALCSGLLLGCASKPPPPDWQANAQGAIERAVAAYLVGAARIEALEFARARSEVARTGSPPLLARIELMRCAARVAALVFEPCAGFEALRSDAAAPERAYAEYLAGRATAADVGLLPAAQRPVAGAAAQGAAPALAALAAVEPALSRLVAAGVLFQAGHASPGVITQAIDTASAQGWRRPLLAWLLVQRERAKAAGDDVEAQRLQRRIDVIEGPR